LYQRDIFNDTNPFKDEISLNVEGKNTQVRTLMMQIDNLESNLALQMSVSCDRAKSSVYFLRSQNANNKNEWLKSDVSLIQCGDSRRIV
jgi:hypothetical protein